jgi:putative glutamine amidotransferase
MRETPLLAICRGEQALNIVRGGTLVQHLPALHPEDGAVAHRQRIPGDQASHGIHIDPASRLAATIDASELGVNSFHHQAIDRLGRGLTAVAWAEDGTIEAIEDRSHPFLVGVQWHAELLIHRREELSLFTAFVEAAASAPARVPDRQAGRASRPR